MRLPFVALEKRFNLRHDAVRWAIQQESNLEIAVDTANRESNGFYLGPSVMMA